MIVGKTLTAEAISEYLHRPLYAVSVGELGTSAVDLENKLSEILEVASIWNAVILIDEGMYEYLIEIIHSILANLFHL